jgi:hypothetical protein
MKKTILGTAVCLGAAIGSAQTMETVHVNLPVAAKVGNVFLPAGAYSIREVSNYVIEISSDAPKGSNTLARVTPIMAPNRETVEHTKVILHKEENGYQVQKIWFEGRDIGFELNTAAE